MKQMTWHLHPIRAIKAALLAQNGKDEKGVQIPLTAEQRRRIAILVNGPKVVMERVLETLK